MAVIVKQKTMDLVVKKAGDKAEGHVEHDFSKYPKDEKVLRMHFSLMGETKPLLSPLSVEYSFGDKTAAYRYDWVLGVTPFSPFWNWNWENDIRDEPAIVVQLLLDPGNSGCSFTEIAATLLSLQPSRDTTSWFDRHFEKIGDSLVKLSEMAQPINHAAANILKVSSMMSSFISPGEGKAKNWFIYRFLDEGKACCAVEWNINKLVLQQVGSLLRGSIILTFHGTRNGTEPMTLLLRPRLNFSKLPLNYIPAADEMEKEAPVSLLVEPSAVPGPVQGGV